MKVYTVVKVQRIYRNSNIKLFQWRVTVGDRMKKDRQNI